MDTYRYILRYFIDAEFDATARIEELAQFCIQARVEEVMLFLTPEELSPGHPTDSEIDTFIRLALQVKERLAQVGVDISLNPWTTLYQVPRGRTLRHGQNFRLMVGETGVQSPIVACPLCPQWQEWICSRFARLAREIQPTAIWIEDDWRLANHGAELGWGGCFCDEHMRLFSERVGQKVIREQLLPTILKPGQPHPWRETWLTLSRETMLEPLSRLSHAIQEANPGTSAALMSSRPDQHSSEGRDWKKIREALSCGGEFLLRPNMPPYTQTYALRNTPAVLRQTLAYLPDDPQDGSSSTNIYPELENSPRCGIFSKSGRYTIWQLIEAALFGSNGITINHFDMMGNGIALDRSFASHLSGAKAKLNALRTLQISDRNAEGAQMLLSPQIASVLHLKLTSPSEPTFRKLIHNSLDWSETCAILGISHRFTTSIAPTRGPVFVCGQTLRALTDAQIRELLSGTLILDADSVLIMLERGFGQSIGVSCAQWRPLEQTGYAYESINEPDASVYGIANPRMSAQRCAEAILEMTPVSEARVRSTIHDSTHSPMWPGTLDFSTPQGGRAMATCYPLGTSQFYMGYFNVFRTAFLQRLLIESTGWAWAMAPNGLRCQRTAVKGGTLFALLNPTDDPFAELSLTVSQDAGAENAQWLHLDHDGNWQTVTPRTTIIDHGLRHTFDLAAGALDSAFLLRKHP